MRALLFLALGLGPVQASGAPSAADAVPTISEDVVVKRVRWPIVVQPARRADPAACATLAPEDFVVAENDQPVRVTSVDREDGPVLYAFLVDVSGSMDPYIDDVKEALVAFVPTIRDGDAVMVASFADALTVHVEPTDRRDAVERAVRDLPCGNRTALFDALREFLGRVEPMPGRRVVVVITDGADSASRGRMFEFARLAASTTRDLRVCSVVPATAEDPRGSSVLRVLAQTTGGRFEWLPGGRGIEQALATIRRRVEHEVVLGYEPAAVSGRTVAVGAVAGGTAAGAADLQRVRVTVDGREGLPCRVRAALRQRVVVPGP
jgi:Ca-activated chloride channel family protein